MAGAAKVGRTVFQNSRRSMAGFPAPRLFDYETVTSNLTVADAIESVEMAFGRLAKGQVDVPMPMHSEFLVTISSTEPLVVARIVEFERQVRTTKFHISDLYCIVFCRHAQLVSMKQMWQGLVIVISKVRLMIPW